MTTCNCPSDIKVEGACYWAIKVGAGLIGDHSPNGHGRPSEMQLRWIGALRERRRHDGWQPAWLAIHDPEDDVDFEASRGIRYVMQIGNMREELSV